MQKKEEETELKKPVEIVDSGPTPTDIGSKDPAIRFSVNWKDVALHLDIDKISEVLLYMNIDLPDGNVVRSGEEPVKVEATPGAVMRFLVISLERIEKLLKTNTIVQPITFLEYPFKITIFERGENLMVVDFCPYSFKLKR